MADAETVKLEPCPFCGGPAMLHSYHAAEGPGPRINRVYWVTCDLTKPGHCQAAIGVPVNDRQSEADAIAAWNRRTAASRAPQADVRREAIEECAKVADEYARFPGEGFVSKVRVSIAASIANRIRALAPPVDEAGEETP